MIPTCFGCCTRTTTEHWTMGRKRKTDGMPSNRTIRPIAVLSGALVLLGACKADPLATSDGGRPASTAANDGGQETTVFDGGDVGDADASMSASSSLSSDADIADAIGTSCLTGSVQFTVMPVPGDLTHYCLGEAGTCLITNATWLSITATDGAVLPQHGPGYCEVSCADCQPVACSTICGAPSPLTEAGAAVPWLGGYIEQDTCGTNVQCGTYLCAPAGDYTAMMCAYAVLDGAPSSCSSLASVPTCTAVPFSWPPPDGSAVVQGEIGTMD